MTLPTSVRAGAGIAVLLVLLLIVGNAWGDYRAATRSEPERKAASTEETKAPATKPAAKPVEKPAEPTSKVIVVTIDGLSFRAEPDRAAERIAVLDKGQRLQYVATEGGWYKAKDADGNVGYVSANKSYTRLEEK